MLIKGSFEDIIYIIIGIAWIAYSIYKGTQKSKSKTKRQETVPETTEPKKEQKSVFESFIDNIIIEEDESPYVPVSEDAQKEEPVLFKQAEPEIKETEKVFSYDDYFEESNYQEAISVYDEKERIQAEEKTEQKIDPTIKRKKPRIDLRKAVVYSEILNRRYI